MTREISESREWWTWGALILLAAVAPLLLFPEGWRVLALVVLPLILVGNRLALGRFFHRTPYDVVIFLLLVMVLVGLIVTYDVTVSLPKVTGVLLGVSALYALVGFAYTEQRFELAVLGLLMVIIGFMALVFVGTQWGSKVPELKEVGEKMPRLIAGLPGAEKGFHPNEVGGTLTWIIFLPIVIALGLWASGRSISTFIATWMLLGLLIAIAFALALTQSRSAWAGTMAGLGALLFLTGRWGKITLGVILFALLAVLLFAGPDRVVEAFNDASTPDVERVANINLEGRMIIWASALNGIRDFPLTGVGIGVFRRVVPILSPLPWTGPSWDLGHAHNELLQAGVDLGIPGLIAFIALQMLAVALAYKTFHSAAPPLVRWTAAGALAGLVAHGVFGLTDAVALGAKPGLFFWLLLGLIAAGWELANEADIRRARGRREAA